VEIRKKGNKKKSLTGGEFLGKFRKVASSAGLHVTSYNGSIIVNKSRLLWQQLQ
jgi:hypothetical protein